MSSDAYSVEIPRGKCASGRPWKSTQQKRFSSVKREGLLKHMSKNLEIKMMEKQKKEAIKALECCLKDETRAKKLEEKQKREENQRRRAANEMKNASYQTLTNEKLKGMSKKQLRMVRKTVVNKDGQVQLAKL